MARYIFDIETNGLLDELTTVHCLVMKDLDSGERFSYGPNTVVEGVRKLAEADLIVGHNIIGFDLIALRRIFPWFRHIGNVIDTLICARLIWPADVLRPKDIRRAQQKKFPGNLTGYHSLEAWGHRLGEYKSKKVDFSVWTEEMQRYCEQDVEVGQMLLQLIESKNYSPMALWLEHAVSFIIEEQEQWGVPFDEAAAGALYAALVQSRLDLERELQQMFPPFFMPGKMFTPKRDNKKMGYVAGAECQKIEETTFNPGSRHHIADRLHRLRGWTPEEFTSSGEPKIDEVVLSKLPWPEARLLSRYLTVQKRIGQLAEGKEALITAAKDGRIHGEVVTNGAVTGRATHKHPNLAQVPKVKKHKERGVLKGEEGGWGWEFRSLFVARAPRFALRQGPWVMVGADASGLELRMLGHFMARWDGGAYAKEVVQGDVHTVNMNAIGLLIRDVAKTWFYAFVYGAGDEKLGKTAKVSAEEIATYKTKRRELWGYVSSRQKKKCKATDDYTIACIIKGGLLRAKFLKNLPALGSLVAAVKDKHEKQQHLVGLDKRLLHTRSDHSALNTLLQSAGALVCKLWLVLMHRALLRRGFIPGYHFAQVLWIHDEVQILAHPEVADEIGKIAVEAVREAGEVFGLKVPLDGEYKIGNTWAETH